MSDVESKKLPESSSKPDNFDVGHIVTGVLIFALIVILIAFLVPTNVHGRSREVRAYSEIKGCELALTKVLSDAGVSDLRDLFSDPTALDGPTDFETLSRHTDAIYALLQNGKNVSLDLSPDIRNRLGSSYMVLKADPWGHRYVFYMPYGHGDDANALDREFLDTYMTPLESSDSEDSPSRFWRTDPLIYIGCRGEDGSLELLDTETSYDGRTVVDDISNLRDGIPAAYH